MAKKNDDSGFDYYLDLLQESKEQNQRDVPRKIFQLLQINGGQMRLFELVAGSLPKDASIGEVDHIVETLKGLQEADLIVVEHMQESEVAAANSSESMIVRVTETGRKVLFSGFASGA
jgi:hypothetical protein